MNFLYIILGWLFGLLTQPISLRIERKYKQKDFKFAIFSELKNLAVRLAATSYKIRTHLGTLDKLSVQWISDIYEKYGDTTKTNTVASSMKEMILKTPDKEFESVINYRRAAENIALSIKNFSLPLIDSLLENISIFDSKFQRKILEIRSQVDILNQEIENSMQYFYLTFNPTSLETNKNILETNMKNSYNQIEEKCKYIVNLINELNISENKYPTETH